MKVTYAMISSLVSSQCSGNMMTEKKALSHSTCDGADKQI